MLWIRIRMDLHHFGNPDPHPHPHKHQLKIRIRIRIRIHIKVKIWILNWIWIRVMVTSRIRIRIKVMRIQNAGSSVRYCKSILHGSCVQANGVPAGGWGEGDWSWAPAALRPLQERRRLQPVSFSALFSFQKKCVFFSLSMLKDF